LVKNGRSNGDELFKEGPRIIDNPQLLSSAFVPDTLVHRDAEIKELANLLRHAARGGTPGNVLITGPSGSGKTVVVKYVMRKLKEAAERSGDAQTLCLVCLLSLAPP